VQYIVNCIALQDFLDQSLDEIKLLRYINDVRRVTSTATSTSLFVTQRNAL
jgi:hypothetical protein